MKKTTTKFVFSPFFFAGIGVLKIGGPIAVHLAGLGLPDVAGASLGAHQHHAKLLAHLVARLAELAAEPHQEYGLIAAENRQREFPQ